MDQVTQLSHSQCRSCQTTLRLHYPKPRTSEPNNQQRRVRVNNVHQIADASLVHSTCGGPARKQKHKTRSLISNHKLLSPSSSSSTQYRHQPKGGAKKNSKTQQAQVNGFVCGVSKRGISPILRVHPYSFPYPSSVIGSMRVPLSLDS